MHQVLPIACFVRIRFTVRSHIGFILAGFGFRFRRWKWWNGFIGIALGAPAWIVGNALNLWKELRVPDVIRGTAVNHTRGAIQRIRVASSYRVSPIAGFVCAKRAMVSPCGFLVAGIGFGYRRSSWRRCIHITDLAGLSHGDTRQGRASELRGDVDVPGVGQGVARVLLSVPAFNVVQAAPPDGIVPTRFGAVVPSAGSTGERRDRWTRGRIAGTSVRTLWAWDEIDRG